MTDTIYVGEVFVDADGNYIGDFSGGDGNDCPLGWAHGTSTFHSGFVDWCHPGGLTGLFNDFWRDPSDHSTQCIAPMLFAVPTESATIVSDPSGPPGLEDHNACLLTGSGDTTACFTFVGAEQSLQPGAHLPPPDAGWEVTNGQIWCFSGWFRMADEAFCSAQELIYIGTENVAVTFTGAKYAYGTGGVAIISGNAPMALSTEWQQMTCRFFWSWSDGPAMPVIMLLGDGWHHVETDTIDYGDFGEITLTKAGAKRLCFGVPWGALLMKDLHLWTCQLIKPGYHTHKVAATVPT